MELATTGAVLLFFILVIVEAGIGARKQIKLYDSADTLNNVLLGMATFFTKFGLKGLILVVYAWFSQFSVFNLGYTWYMWVLLFFANDLMFYLFHRLSHESRIFWAAHVAHHNSTKMNVTTSVRGNFVIMTYRFFFWMPLVFLGFPALPILFMDSLAFFYQSWLHTELIGKLGPLEKVFNTPSNHRVHHGRNPQYIDKNYGAVLIIWDKLFGTYEEEHEKVKFGITKPLKSNNPLHVAFHEYADIWKDVKLAQNWSHRWNYIFGHPGWQPLHSEKVYKEDLQEQVSQ